MLMCCAMVTYLQTSEGAVLHSPDLNEVGGDKVVMNSLDFKSKMNFKGEVYICGQICLMIWGASNYMNKNIWVPTKFKQ